MNYQKVYNSLMDRAKTRSVEQDTYYETHHIVPKCLGGSDLPENLVKLTAREHFIAHLLLCGIYPEDSGLLYALTAMVSLKNNHQDRYQVSSRIVQKLKEAADVAKRSRRWVNNGISSRNVSEEDSILLLQDGWIYGRLKSTVKGRIVVHNSERDFYIDPEELEEYLEAGYSRGSKKKGLPVTYTSSIKGKICVHNNQTTKRVDLQEAQVLLEQGWQRGYHYKIDYTKRKNHGGRKKLRTGKQ